MAVKFSKQFSKQYDKSPQKIKQAFDQFHPLLHNHQLLGKYAGCRSINVTGDWRAIFRELEEGGLIYFDMIGTHSHLYR